MQPESMKGEMAMATTLQQPPVATETAMVIPMPNLSHKWFALIDGRDVDSVDEARTFISIALGQVQMSKKKVTIRFSIEDDSP
jgi:hypothetical protein